MLNVLILATLALAARLLADLTSTRELPIFRCYLLAFCIGIMLHLNIPADTVLVVIVIILKITATIEIVRLLCRHMDGRRSWALYGCGLLLGIAGWLLLHNFAQQGNLAHPILWYVKRSFQLMLAIFLSTVIAFQWRYYPSSRNAARRHGPLITALWWNYVGGLLAPRGLGQWEFFATVFYAPAIVILFIWILAVRANSSARQRHPLSQPVLP